MFGAVGAFLGLKESAKAKLAREKEEKKAKRREDKHQMMETAKNVIPKTDLLGNVLTDASAAAGVPPAPEIQDRPYTAELRHQDEASSSSSGSSSGSDSDSDTSISDAAPEEIAGHAAAFQWALQRGRQPCRLDRVLEEFYGKYNPDRVSNIVSILHGYEGDEQLMLRQLCDRYTMTQADMQVFVDYGFELHAEAEGANGSGAADASDHFQNGTARPGSILKRAGQAGAEADASNMNIGRRVSIQERSNTSHHITHIGESSAESDPESDSDSEPESEEESAQGSAKSAPAPPRPPPPKGAHTHPTHPAPPPPNSAHPAPPPPPRASPRAAPAVAEGGDSDPESDAEADSEPESATSSGPEDPEDDESEEADGDSISFTDRAPVLAPAPPAPKAPLAPESTEVLLKKKIRTNLPSAANHYASAIEANSSFILDRRVSTKAQRQEEKRVRKLAQAMAEVSGTLTPPKEKESKEEMKARKEAAKQAKQVRVCASISVSQSLSVTFSQSHIQ